MSKTRIDLLLVQKGLAASREQAKRAIIEGRVNLNGRPCTRPSESADEHDDLVIGHAADEYVSRGGQKLEKAIKTFGISLDGMICADIGASTGGFTDCMLRNGASRVYALDVGHGQLHSKLRDDARVVNIEKINFRYFDPEVLGEKADFAAMDVSFISAKLMLAPLSELLKPDAGAVCLIKPQFEAGKSYINKSGTVSDPKIHEKVIGSFINELPAYGLSAAALTWSPVREKGGNIEYLAHIFKTEACSRVTQTDVHTVVIEAFACLW